MANFKIARGTQSAYNAITTKDTDTIYVCTDTGNIYLGSKALFESDAFANASISGKTVTFTTHGANGTTGTKTISLTDFATTSEVQSAIDAAIGSVYVYKGSCTYAELPSTGNKAGDTWDVTDEHTESGKTYPAGTNYAWNGSAWDPLGGDVSNFKTKQSAVSDPTASGNATSFIASITQNENGEITPTKKTIPNASGSAAGLMSSTHYTKLEGIEQGAQVNVLEGVQVNGTDLPVSGKKVNIVTNSPYNASTNKIATMNDVANAALAWGSF